MNKNEFKCEMCNKKFETEETLQGHITYLCDYDKKN
jgi:hypothetical protein